jgi:hypothetical protein
MVQAISLEDDVRQLPSRATLHARPRAEKSLNGFQARWLQASMSTKPLLQIPFRFDNAGTDADQNCYQLGVTNAF